MKNVFIMLKSRELRVGNLVKCAKHLPIGFHAPQLVYAEVVEVREASVETSEGVYKYHNLGPLKLSEEILLKNGGIKNESNEYVFKTHHHHYTNLILIEENGFFYLSDGNHTKMGQPFDSIHHFQNLYYILTNADISITI